MKNILIIIVLISFCVSSFNVLAQEQNPVLPEGAMELLNKMNQIENSGSLNYLLSEQQGSENSIDLFSVQNSLVDMSIVAIGQYGNSNSGIVNQNGQGQEIGIYQKGNENMTDLSVKGNNIYSIVTQVGNSNLVKQDIENYNSELMKSVSTEQFGNSNVVKLITGTMDYSTVEITQNGSNNTVDLNLNNMGSQSSPYTVKQTGNDASIIISRSDFYMPMINYNP